MVLFSWLFKILEEEQLKGNPNKILIRAQRAQFVESGDEVLFISIVHALRLWHGCWKTTLLERILIVKIKFLWEFLTDSRICAINDKTT